MTRAAVAAATATLLAGAGTAIAPVASATPSSGTTINVAITDHGMYVDGPTTFPAGRVHLSIDAVGKERGIELIYLDPGYTFQDLRSDLKIAFNNLFGPGGHKKRGLRHLRHVFDNATAVGGIYAGDGEKRHGTVLALNPGANYILFDDSGSLPKRPVRLTVTSPVGPQTLPPTEKKVVAKPTKRWGGNDVLPAHGTVQFVNRSTTSPHFLVLLHVKKGTTRKQVINAFQSDSPPDFFLDDEQDIDLLSPGQRMNVGLHLPPGLYAEACFFPDLKDGTPHAIMGMVAMVHLR